MDREPATTQIDEESQIRRRLTWRSLFVLITIVMAVTVLLGVAILWMWQSAQPQVIQPGEIIDMFGKYQSIDNRVHFTVDQSDVSNECYWRVSQEAPVGQGTSRVKFDASASWFTTVDPSGRAWLFATSDAVSGEGIFVWGGNSSIYRMSIVGEHGGWEGIPKSFLEKLPEKHRADYRAWVQRQAK